MQKEEKMTKPKPEEHEGMPQHQPCPHAKHCGDRNPKYRKEQQNSRHICPQKRQKGRET
jgi:hypothetical protein